MSEHIHLTAVKPSANPGPGIAKPPLVGTTMCGEDYYPGAHHVVDRKATVTCPECLDAIEKSSMLIP